jgi:hypothetical protein
VLGDLEDSSSRTRGFILVPPTACIPVKVDDTRRFGAGLRCKPRQVAPQEIVLENARQALTLPVPITGPVAIGNLPNVALDEPYDVRLGHLRRLGASR